MRDQRERLDPKHTCLLFFDTSNVFVNGPTLDPQARSPLVTDAVANWRRQLAKARELKMMVVYGLTAHRPDGENYFARLTDTDMGSVPYPEGSGRQQLGRTIIGRSEITAIEEIPPSPEDYFFWKPRWSPFHQTALELSLRGRGVDTVIVNGGSIEIGIAATVYAAQALDFDVVVVSDGCTSRHQDCQEVFMTKVFPRIGRVRTTAQVLRMLEGTRGSL